MGKPDYKRVSLDDAYSDDELDDFEDAPQRGNGTGGRPPQQHLQMLREQDAGLEMLSRATERLGAMSLAISEELGQQNVVLDAMDADLERATTDMDVITRKTKEFIEQSGGTKNFMIILCLSVVVVILVFLILYT